MTTKTKSSPCQVFGGEDKAFDPAAAHNPFDDFGDVGDRDAAIKEMIGLDQNADTARALVETTGGTNARPELGCPPRG
jgi:hypothetical protein